MKRFSLNQATTRGWPLPALAEGCVAAGVTQVGLWREEVQEFGVSATAELMRSSGLSVTTLCRGGFFDRPDWLSSNVAAIEEAAELGAPVLVLVSGGLPSGSRDVDAARAHIGESLGALVPYALDAGVQLAIEPLHPMFCSDRCVVSTLAQALDLAEPYPAAAVGVAVDTYHLWWDDTVWSQIARAGAAGRIACFQVADWITPLPAGVLLGRGLPGTGCIELRRFREAVDATGFTGPIEVEVFNEEVWARPGLEILADTIEGYRRFVE
ncbi:sugar phosphate isomerase/epimerase family protein [Winogradskya humida]|uniref:Xylose isomerase n=1 Tax=Winogradskya humida TaxID=113566 RepID=A0ABQ3ZJM1_9ACTN|nr:sugar phosphate isomerase/epimerase family protein [Actinoplanes humidus]GIE18790.1 xylose isomerase [Actinoplanes humidus]